MKFIEVKKEQESVSPEKIREYLVDILKVEVQDSIYTENEKEELGRLTQQVISIRKMGNRFINEILCGDEAKQFYWIYKERGKSKELADKIWFITNDHFIADLYERNINIYAVPISYTPLGWYQYLQLVDYDARASKNFSKLFAFSEIGALDDDLAIGAIKEMLTKESELIKKGGATVTDFAEQLVIKYHIKNVFKAYAKAKYIGSEEKGKYEKAVKDSVSSALSDFIAVKKVDLKRFEETEHKLKQAEKKVKQERYKRKQTAAQLTYLQSIKASKKKKK
jgi:hypothetical protein